MDGLKRYDAHFSRLLFDRGFRDRVRAGDWSALGPEADAFRDIDQAALERLAAAIRDGLAGGGLGGLAIGQAFAATTAALGGGTEAVVERFLQAHDAVDAFDGTCRQAGVSVFESFHNWAETQLVGRPADRNRAQHELATALFEILARKPNPGFLVRWPLARALSCGWYCVLDAARPLEGPLDAPEQPVAYVAALGQYVAGADALDFAAIALDAAGSPPAWVSEHLPRIDAQTLAELRQVLAEREQPWRALTT